MPYTFGGDIGDDISFSAVTTFGSTARAGLVCGWWRPTTLTAGRRLWACGADISDDYAATIDTTTDELRLHSNNITTNGEWTTAGVDLTVDQWTFLAIMGSTLNSGSAEAWRVWSGTVETAPVERTATQAVASVGNFAGNATFCIGNNQAGYAFEGDIADVSMMISSAAVGVTTNPFGIAAHGAITNAEALHVYETLVLPIWLGDPSVMFTEPVVGNLSRYHWSGDVGGLIVGNTNTSATLGPIAPTINGASWSQNGAPRPSHMPDMLPMRRR